MLARCRFILENQLGPSFFARPIQRRPECRSPTVTLGEVGIEMCLARYRGPLNLDLNLFLLPIRGSPTTPRDRATVWLGIEQVQEAECRPLVTSAPASSTTYATKITFDRVICALGLTLKKEEEEPSRGSPVTRIPRGLNDLLSPHPRGRHTIPQKGSRPRRDHFLLRVPSPCSARRLVLVIELSATTDTAAIQRLVILRLLH